MEGATRPTGTVTFLFTDVEGSTALWETHPAAMTRALARHDELVRGAIGDHSGYVFSTAGDAFSAAFAAPVDGVLAALAIQDRLAAEPWPEGAAIAVRAGLHSGTADERDGDYFGPTVNRAARIMGVARGGQVIASAATVELARSLETGGVSFVDLGQAELRGIGAERLFGVVAPGADASFGPVGGADAPIVRLPFPATTFIGRELEVVELISALDAARLLTLVGPGGVGKTRLAIESGWAVTDSFPDGVWLVELAPVRERDAVAHTMVTALEVRPLPGRSPVDSLIAGLAAQRRLIIVDNCEHVLGEVAGVVRQVVERCPTVKVLTTSRAPLAVPGERVWPVAPLSAAGAGAALFVDRATAVGGRVVGADADGAVLALCERLDGMPLAIELAAARARAMTPSELLARLSDRFWLLRSSRREGDERHATLQATVEWSYQLLDDVAQTVFDRMGIFAAAVDLDAVVAVVGGGELDDLDVLDALTTLVDHSLVVAEPEGDVTRYRLLDTMRAFARNRLEVGGALPELSVAHGDWAAGRCVQLNAELIGVDEPSALAAVDEMERFWPDLRAAVMHALDVRDADLAGRLLGPFSMEALWRERAEVADWVERAFTLAETRAHDCALDMLGVAALLAWRAGRYEDMAGCVAAGFEIRPDGRGSVTQVFWMAETVAMIVGGHVEEARGRLVEVQALLPPPGAQDFDAVYVDIGIGLVDCYRGRFAEVSSRLSTMGMPANPIHQAFHAWVAATALLDLDPEAAIEMCREAIARARRSKVTWMVDTVSNYLTAALVRAGEPADALETMRSVLAHAVAGGGVQSIANTVRNAIVLLPRLGFDGETAVLSGWLDAQSVALPGTASMRAHAAEAATNAFNRLGSVAATAARERGAVMSSGEIARLLLTTLDQATAQSVAPEPSAG